MKLSSGDKALLFFAAGLLVLSVLSFKKGDSHAAACWLLGVSGCAVMLYAAHGGKARKG